MSGNDYGAGRVVQRNKTLFYLLILFLSVFSIRSAVKGSNTAVSLEAAPTFLAADNDNTMLGFGWFKNGFTLQDVLTTCTFDSVFPVSGNVDLNGGTLYLSQDLVFRDVSFISSGKFIGHDHTMQIYAPVHQFPTNSSELDSVRVFCNADLDVISTVTFKGDCVLCGVGSVLTLKDNAEFIVAGGATLELRDLELRGISGLNIRCTDETARIVLDNVRWVQSESFTLSAGSVLFKDQVSFMGTNTFFYASSQTSTIDNSSTLIIGDGMHFCIGRDFDTLNEPLEMTDSTSILKLDNCDFIVTASGIQFTKGTLVVDRNVALDALSTTTEHGIIIGDGNPDNDITIWLSPGSSVRHKSGFWVYNNAEPDKFRSSSLSTRLIRDIGSMIYLPQNLTVKDFTVELLSNYVTPVSVAAGKSVNYSNAAVRLPDVAFDMTAKQLNAITYQLANGGEIFFTKGTLPSYTQVQGTGNKLRGNGGITGLITLEDSSAQLNCGVTGFIDSDVTLNNGKITLDTDLALLAHSGIVGPGAIDIQSHVLTFCLGTMNVATPTYWQGNNGSLNLQGKLSLMSTWTVGGKCVINGNNNRIVLDTGGEIVVDKGGELVLKNAEIHGLSNNNIKCLDEDGRITFLNTQSYLDANYSFTIGALQFYRLNHITGPYTFSYDSPQTSTIKSDAKLVLRDDVVLLIGKNGGNQPLEFEDNTGILKFDNSKFSIKNSGMQLSKGTVNSSRDVEISIASSLEVGSLVFGDGTVSGDMEFVLNPGSTARFTQGHATFNVTSGNGIRSKSKTAQLIRGANSVYLLKQDLTLENISIAVDPLAAMTIDMGKTLDYINGRIILAQGEFDLSGIRYSATTSLLGGNHNLTLINGDMPLATLVLGTGNTIEGTGNITGPVILQSAPSLTIGLNGTFGSSITLANGVVTLAHDLNLGNAIVLTGPGIVNTGSYNLNFGSANIVWPTDMRWEMNSGALNMHSAIDLQGTWTFDGVGEIKGNGQLLMLGKNGKLVITPNSRLCLRDLHIDQTGTRIECLGDDSVLVLDNVIWSQHCDHNYTFSTGAIVVKNKVNMTGRSTFVYQSVQTSTICEDARLKLDTALTFSYDPLNLSKNNLVFEDETSSLLIKNASLHVTTTGMHLTRGTLQIEGHSFIASEVVETDETDDIVVTLDEGITLGDGLVADNDMKCIIGVGSQLQLTSGSLHYNNLNASSWTSLNKLSRLSLLAGVKFDLQQSLNMGVGQLQMSKKTLIESATGASLEGAVFIGD